VDKGEKDESKHERVDGNENGGIACECTQERRTRGMGVVSGSLLVVIQVDTAGNKGRH
jgi:hypothetical protein